ncbi:M23 family metallopeptidase [Actinotalea solisilvae]|uniref:M23 family metallopeptidase n=1 Tax=Actinotalea solisilvae TaxID=2072922 RepID=UPI0027DBD343|nr:peptidoglycan DD-metalloendopeptidase family protein [Actinotalea solisilvae]
MVLPGPGSATTAAAPGPARAAGTAGAAAGAPTAPRSALEAVARAAGLDDAGSYGLPVPGGAVRSRFDPPAQRWAAGHRGVDLDAPAGTTVVAPAAGTVVVAGPVVDRHVLTLLHDDGRRSSLEPVVAAVAVGARVEAGAVVGSVEPPPAATHCAPRCLHWGVREGERYVDPLALLPGAGPVVLLPVAGSHGR